MRTPLPCGAAVAGGVEPPGDVAAGTVAGVVVGGAVPGSVAAGGASGGISSGSALPPGRSLVGVGSNRWVHPSPANHSSGQACASWFETVNVPVAAS